MLYTRDAGNPHAHAQDRRARCVRRSDGYDFDVFRAVAFPRLQAMAPLRYQLVDIPLKLHHPMWVLNDDIDFDYHVRRMPGARARRPPRTRPVDRRDRQHAAGPQPPAVGDVRRRGAGRRPHRDHPQGPPRAGRRRRRRPTRWRRRCSRTGPTEVRGDVRRARHRADQTRAAEGGGTRPRRARPQAAPAGERDGDRGVAGPAPVQGARRASRPGPQLRAAGLLHQPRASPRAAGSRRRRWRSATSRRPAKHLGVTINDIVLAMAAGALRQLLLRYDGKADEPLIAGVPVSTNPSTERLAGNEFTYMTPSLPVHIADPLERVKADLVGDHHRQGEPPTARADDSACVAVLSAACARAARVPQAGTASRVGAVS